MEKFKELDKRKQGIIIVGIIIVLLITIILIYRTYAIYQNALKFNMIEGSVPNQDYDIKFAFLLEDENGTSVNIDEMPQEKKYDVTIECNNGATGEWDYETWGPQINQLTKTRTKCNITFKVSKPLQNYGIHESLTGSGDGLYRVNHHHDHIDYSADYDDLEILKQTEYRYAGSNPNNYVLFNNELWRMIGLVNTPEGQRLKLIRNEKIGEYSWDSSDSNINYGWGINEWSQAKLMKILNEEAYYNRTSGTCYNEKNNQTIPCNFTNNGLTSEAKNMIDTITWNIGSQYKWISTNTTGLTKHHYEYERGSASGKRCSGAACNDTVTRTITWSGMVGLIYPSDYGYATSGGNTLDRSQCLNKILYNEWNTDLNADCKNNNWIYKNSNQWTIIPVVANYDADLVANITKEGGIYFNNAYQNNDVFPSIYLKNNIKITGGSGNIDAPYQLTIT